MTTDLKVRGIRMRVVMRIEFSMSFDDYVQLAPRLRRVLRPTLRVSLTEGKTNSDLIISTVDLVSKILAWCLWQPSHQHQGADDDPLAPLDYHE